jgi:hypothetical protein
MSLMQSDNPGKPPFSRAVIAVVRAIVTVAVLAYDLLAAIFAPVLRPLWRWLSGLTLFRAIGDWIGRQHPYVVLVLLGVPFVVIEPGKGFAVLWAAMGHPSQGAILLAIGEILSLLVCERIFHAGYEPLMRIGWFKRLLTWLFGLRDRALGWARSTALWRGVREAWTAVRGWRAAILARRRR